MDKDKHLSIVGQVVNIQVVALLDDPTTWKAEATALYGITRDGDNWATEKNSVSAYDKNAEAAIATAMLAISNHVNSPELMAALNRSLDEFEKQAGVERAITATEEKTKEE